VKLTSLAVAIHGAHAHVNVFLDGKLSGTLVVGADEVDALRAVLGASAEVERLRAELAQLASNYATAAAVHIVDQRELAVANALLVKMTTVRLPKALRDLLTDHLAAQPATAPLSEDLGKALVQVVEAEHAAGCRYEREYPALDPEDCPRCSQGLRP
jgi:hypothetical protein